MAREWLSTPLSPHRKTASPWNGTSAAIEGLFVLFRVKTPNVLKCSLPLFFSVPTALARWRSFKSYRSEENATIRSFCVTMSRAFLPARVRVTDPSCVREERRRFSITDKHDIAITSRRAVARNTL